MPLDSKSGSITSVLHETRVFPPPAEFANQPTSPASPSTRHSGTGPRTTPRASGPSRPRSLALVQALGQGARLEAPVREMVRRAASSTRRTTASTATAKGRTRTRPPSSGKASRATAACLRYQDLLREVSKFANVLKGLGVKKGDVVAIYMPMVPELVIATAGLRPDRRAAHGDLRRLQRRGACRAGSRTARPRSSSPPTAAIAAARSSRSRRTPTAPRPICPTLETRRRLPADRPRRSTGRRAATTGGTS